VQGTYGFALTYVAIYAILDCVCKPLSNRFFSRRRERRWKTAPVIFPFV
jgi:hypothetical protein